MILKNTGIKNLNQFLFEMVSQIVLLFQWPPWCVSPSGKEANPENVLASSTLPHPMAAATCLRNIALEPSHIVHVPARAVATYLQGLFPCVIPTCWIQATRRWRASGSTADGGRYKRDPRRTCCLSWRTKPVQVVRRTSLSCLWIGLRQTKSCCSLGWRHFFPPTTRQEKNFEKFCCRIRSKLWNSDFNFINFSTNGKTYKIAKYTIFLEREHMVVNPIIYLWSSVHFIYRYIIPMEVL